MAASPSSTVDLSRLPAPAIVALLPYEEILAELVTAVRARLPSFDATIDSDPAMIVLQVAAYRELLLRGLVNDACRQVMLAYATGTSLDQLAALVGVSRLVVAPADPVLGTPELLEADDDLRQRVVLAPERFTVAGPELAYVARAKEVSGDVLDASAISPAPGEVLVSVLARAGDGTAPAPLIAAVAARVTDPAVRPLGDLVTVASAQIVPFVVRASLTTFAGPDPSIILQAARDRLDAFLIDNRRLGRTITRSGLVAALSPAGVHRVDLDLDTDIACSAVQAAHCTAIEILHAGAVA